MDNSENLQSFVITYDVEDDDPSPYDELLDQAEANGWSRWVFGAKTKKYFRLPNTTLIGEFADKLAAEDAFLKAVKSTGKELGIKVVVSKYFLAAYSTARFVSDEKVKNKP